MERTTVTEKNKLTPFDIVWGEISNTYTVYLLYTTTYIYLDIYVFCLSTIEWVSV